MSERLFDDEIIEIARRCKSLMHRDELAWLMKLARYAPDGIGVEIGVYCGASLIAWSLVRHGRGESIGIDNFSFSGMIPHKVDIKAECEANLQATGVKARLIDGDSVQIAKQVPDGLAFVFIDGDHTSPAIDNDIVAWTPKIMRGGIIAFHDYGRRKNGCRVSQAVDNWQAVDRWGDIGKVETTIGFRRP